MKKRFKRLLNKKGVTLVELIVVLFVSSILLGIAMGMLRPVTNLMESIKGNAGMDTMSDIANEYIRNCMEKSVAVSAVSYTDLDAIKATWKTYTDTFTKAKGYSVRAIGVLGNYNGDFRLYDFGEVNVIDQKWGTSFQLKSADDGISHGTAFVTMIRDRDGGGHDKGGLNGNEFHKFDAFNEAFYSNGTEGSANYSFEVAFEINDKEISNGSTTVSGVSRVTLYSQIFKRTGNRYSSDPSEKILKFEPANQVRSITFELLNGTAELDVSQNVNTVETDSDGSKTIKLATNEAGETVRDGLVILYVVRDIDVALTLPSIPTTTPSFEISGGGIYAGFNGNWFGINDDKPSQTLLVIKNNSGSSIDTKDVTIEFTGDFTNEKLSFKQPNEPVTVSNAGTIPWPINEQKGNLYKVTLGNWYHDEENDKWEIRGLTWNDGETLTINKMEINGDIGFYDPILKSYGKVTIYVQGKVVWSKTIKK